MTRRYLAEDITHGGLHRRARRKDVLVEDFLPLLGARALIQCNWNSTLDRDVEQTCREVYKFKSRAPSAHSCETFSDRLDKNCSCHSFISLTRRLP